MKYSTHMNPADDSFIVNCGAPDGSEPDPSLKPIRISLPSPPELSLIDGYNLPEEDQFWRRPVMPEKLVNLEKKIRRDLESKLKTNKNERVTGYKILDGIWDEIKSNLEFYEEEIIWIKKQWWHRLYGYWFFNNGKPTYICGWHYFYLSFWKIEGRIYPDYRDRDRKNFLFWWYSKTTKESFKNYDQDGNALPNENGEYEMEEMPSRVCYGTAQPKNRRGGTTNMSQSSQFEDTSKIIGGLAAMFSMTETSASALFTGKTVKSWAHIPFFFLPYWSGYFDERNSIDFKRPKHILVGDHLNSTITYAKSAFGGEFDGERITFGIFDESGKCKEADVQHRWDTHKQGMSIGEGADIIGFSIHPSTVEDMDSDGGAHYQNLISDSNFYQRNPITGQTKSGLFRLFFPGYEGLENFIGKYGESIINEPTKQQIKDGFKFKHGSKKHLQSSRDLLLNSKDPKDKIKYKRLVVKFPFTLDECFKLSVGSASWNIEIIDKRMAELRREKEPFIRGNFEWVNGRIGDPVIFVPKVDGKFEVSKIFPVSETNQRVRTTVFDPLNGVVKECWMPKYPNKGTLGVDPFKFKGDKLMAIETGGYQSDGGIAGLLERDLTIDPLEKSIFDCITPTFVIAYRNRPLSKEFNEDAIKAAQWAGFMIYHETNAGTLWEFCLEHGYDGYLLYDIDEVTGKPKPRPGVYQSESSKEVMWTEFQNYIEYRAHKENHASILKEIAALKTFDDLRRNDLAAAAGCALLGSKSRAREILESLNEKEDYGWWLQL